MVMRPFPPLALLITMCACLCAQDAREVILAARRTPVVEIIDAASLDTIVNLHFDTQIEKLQPSADGRSLFVDGYTQDGGCCRHYLLDLASMKLSDRDLRNYGVASLPSPDGRWRFDLMNFPSPTLTTVNLHTKETVQLAPAVLPPENRDGNWAAAGTWSEERFYYYVARPNHPGFLWTVVPGDRQLGAAVAVEPFGEVPGCSWHSPITKGLAAAAGNVFLYESFGNKVDRFRCKTQVPGGAWKLDPATGRVTGYIAPGFHFNRLVADRSGSTLVGVDPGVTNWSGPVLLVSLDARDGTIFKTRNFDPGVLQIAIGQLRNTATGEVRVLSPKIAEH
jgi:hypothetical protein